VTSGFGVRRDPITGTRAFHRGIDVAAPRGSAIHAVASGEVTFSGRRGRAGNVVEVRDGDIVSTYAHVARALVHAGQKVAAGDVLATIGSTGRTTGPHVHFAVTRDGQAVDPAAILESTATATAPPSGAPEET
jgi:murein DD-endopeptidase MepM/ murein hydrolase activator NlpD